MERILSFPLAILIIIVLIVSPIDGQDWANLERFKNENANLKSPTDGDERVVFMGNSITEGWNHEHLGFFTNPAYINRGISGQTTPQMLLRFRQDVIDLQPAAVVILAGTNDIAGNTGPMTLEMIAGNIFSMAELASAHDIKVILASVLPAFEYTWSPGKDPAHKIPELNAMIAEYADANGHVYLDYFTAMADERNGLPHKLGPDGVHPNEAGYAIMAPLAKKAIAEALTTK